MSAYFICCSAGKNTYVVNWMVTAFLCKKTIFSFGYQSMWAFI